MNKQEALDALNMCGFSTAETIGRKADPRGDLHGDIEVDYNVTGGFIQVRHSKGYAMCFHKAADFIQWSEDMAKNRASMLFEPTNIGGVHSERSHAYRMQMAPIIWVLEHLQQTPRAARNIDIHNLDCTVLTNGRVLWPALVSRHNRGGYNKIITFYVSQARNGVLMQETGGDLPTPEVWAPFDAVERLVPPLMDRILGMMGSDI